MINIEELNEDELLELQSRVNRLLETEESRIARDVDEHTQKEQKQIELLKAFESLKQSLAELRDDYLDKRKALDDNEFFVMTEHQKLKVLVAHQNMNQVKEVNPITPIVQNVLTILAGGFGDSYYQYLETLYRFNSSSQLVLTVYKGIQILNEFQ